MKIYTAHTHPRRPPILIREGASWGAFLFGPLWLLWHAAWIAAALTISVLAVICVVAPPHLRPLLAFAGFAVLGLTGNDLRRWNLGLGRYRLAHVVAARDRDAAYLRLLSQDPALLAAAP